MAVAAASLSPTLSPHCHIPDVEAVVPAVLQRRAVAVPRRLSRSREACCDAVDDPISVVTIRQPEVLSDTSRGPGLARVGTRPRDVMRASTASRRRGQSVMKRAARKIAEFHQQLTQRNRVQRRRRTYGAIVAVYRGLS